MIFALQLKSFLKNDYVWGFFATTLIVIIFFLPVIIGKQTLFAAVSLFYKKDSLSYHYPGIRTPWVADPRTHSAYLWPQTIAAVDMMHRGIVPLWTPYEAAGQPLTANLASGMYNPIRLIYFYFFHSLKASDLFIVFRLIAMAFGLFLFLKSLGLEKESALLGGIAYAFSGFFIDNVTVWFNDIFATLPYLLYIAEKYFEKRSWLFVGLGGLIFSILIFGSHPEITIMCALFFIAYFLFKIFTDANMRAQWLKDLGKLILLCLLGSLIASPLVVDLFNFISVGYPYHWAPVMPPSTIIDTRPLTSLINLVINPMMFFEVAIAGGITHKFPTNSYFNGLAVVVLLLLCLTTQLRSKTVRFFAASTLISIMLMWEVPPFNLLRSMPNFFSITYARLLGILTLCVSILAAVGYDSLQSLKTLPRKFWLIIVTLPAVVTLTFLTVPHLFSNMFVPYFDFTKNGADFDKLLNKLPATLSHLASFLLKNGVWIVVIIFSWFIFVYCLSVFLIYRYTKTKNKFYLMAIVFLLIAELWVYMPKIRDGFNPQNPYAPPPYLDFLLTENKKNIFRVISTNKTFTHNLGDMFKIEQFFGAGTVYPKRWWNFVQGYTYLENYIDVKLPDGALPKIPQSFFDAANIKYILTENYIPKGKNFDLVYDKDIKIYENKTVFPRAYMRFSTINASGLDNSREIFYQNSKFNENLNVVIEDADDIHLEDKENEGGALITIKNYQENKVQLKVSNTRKGVLVLADSFYPGWRAFVDGKTATIYPANIMFRGLIIDKGEHEITFIYQPGWFLPTIIISLLSILICLFLLFFEKIKIWKKNLLGF